MSAPILEHDVRHARELANELLPEPDFTQPGPNPIGFEQAAREVLEEYADALEVLGKI